MYSVLATASAAARAGGAPRGARHRRTQSAAAPASTGASRKVHGRLPDTTSSGLMPAGGEGAGHVHRQNGKADGGGRRPGLRPGQLQHGKPTSADIRCPPIKARGCAGSSIRAIRSPARSRWRTGSPRADNARRREPLHDADGDGAPRPRPRPPAHCGDRCGRSLSQRAANPVSFAPPKNKGRQIALPPLVFDRRSYFRLVSAVRSAESLTMPAAPHQFEPTPDGLIGVTKVPALMP